MAKKDKKEEDRYYPRTIDYAGKDLRRFLEHEGKAKQFLALHDDKPQEHTAVDVHRGLSNYEFTFRCARYFGKAMTEDAISTGPPGPTILPEIPEDGLYRESPDEIVEEYPGGHVLGAEDMEAAYTDEAHVFEVEPKVAVLLEETDVDWEPIRLPFPYVFLDARLALEDRQFYGISARELITEHQPGFPLIWVNAYYWHDESPHVGHVHFTLPYRRPKKVSREMVRQVRHLTRCLVNFVYILDQPEVKLVKWEPTEKSERRARAKGFSPRPPITKVKVRGELRMYLDRLHQGGKRTYTHAFWVRGHWRHYRSPRYSDSVRGTKRWIPPYIKGEGMLVPKAYDVDPIWAKRRGPRRKLRSDERLDEAGEIRRGPKE